MNIYTTVVHVLLVRSLFADSSPLQLPVLGQPDLGSNSIRVQPIREHTLERAPRIRPALPAQETELNLELDRRQELEPFGAA